MPSRRICAAIIATLSAAVAPAVAQDWPTRPVTMVVPFTPAGNSDVVGRILAPRLSDLLGQQVNIENISGAGGMIGASRVAKARADGYQILLGNVGTHAQNQTLYESPLYNAATDFAPVALLAEIQFILTTRKDFPAENLREFIDYAKVNQAKMQYGSGGAGSPPHLACALFNAAAGINVTHIPYRGVGPATQDMIAGRIDYLCPGAASAIANVESRLVKAMAIFSKARSPLMPNYASAHEQGLTSFEATGWVGIFAPRDTPAPIVRKLNTAAIATLETPAVQARLRDVGADIVAPERRSPEYLQRFVQSEIEKWAAAIKAAGLVAQ